LIKLNLNKESKQQQQQQQQQQQNKQYFFILSFILLYYSYNEIDISKQSFVDIYDVYYLRKDKEFVVKQLYENINDNNNKYIFVIDIRQQKMLNRIIEILEKYVENGKIEEITKKIKIYKSTKNNIENISNKISFEVCFKDNEEVIDISNPIYIKSEKQCIQRSTGSLSIQKTLENYPLGIFQFLSSIIESKNNNIEYLKDSIYISKYNYQISENDFVSKKLLFSNIKQIFEKANINDRKKANDIISLLKIINEKIKDKKGKLFKKIKTELEAFCDNCKQKKCSTPEIIINDKQDINKFLLNEEVQLANENEGGRAQGFQLECQLSDGMQTIPQSIQLMPQSTTQLIQSMTQSVQPTQSMPQSLQLMQLIQAMQSAQAIQSMSQSLQFMQPMQPSGGEGVTYVLSSSIPLMSLNRGESRTGITQQRSQPDKKKSLSNEVKNQYRDEFQHWCNILHDLSENATELLIKVQSYKEELTKLFSESKAIVEPINNELLKLIRHYELYEQYLLPAQYYLNTEQEYQKVKNEISSKQYGSNEGRNKLLKKLHKARVNYEVMVNYEKWDDILKLVNDHQSPNLKPFSKEFTKQYIEAKQDYYKFVNQLNSNAIQKENQLLKAEPCFNTINQSNNNSNNNNNKNNSNHQSYHYDQCNSAFFWKKNKRNFSKIDQMKNQEQHQPNKMTRPRNRNLNYKFV